MVHRQDFASFGLIDRIIFLFTGKVEIEFIGSTKIEVIAIGIASQFQGFMLSNYEQKTEA